MGGEEARETIAIVLEELVNGRLLVTGKEENRSAWVDLAHEALMFGWQRFAEWRLEDRDLRRLGDRVEDGCKEWQEKGKSEDYLLPNGLMLEVREQLSSMKVLLSAAAWNYYQESEQNATDKVAFIERNLIEIKLREEAIRILNLPPIRSVSASVQIIKNTGTSLEKLNRQVLAPIQSLLRSNVELAREVQCWLGHEGWVSSVAFSPDGKQIVSGSADNTIRLWDLHGNQIGQPFQGHENLVMSVVFSPDGKQIVSGSTDNTIRLWRGGDWQDWLEVCCNRLRYHSVFKNPPDALTREACEICRKYVWEAQ